MSTEPSRYTLKVNIRAQEEREKREKERQLTHAISKIQSISGQPAKPRKRKGLNFHEPGKFIAQGEQLRKKAKLEALKKRIAQRSVQTGIADATKLATLTTSTKAITKEEPNAAHVENEEVPDIEWWDKPLIGHLKIDEVIPKLVEKIVKPEQIFHGITNLVEHPPMKRPPGPDTTNVQLPIFLTKKERKKLRRQNRKNQELEKQEKIKLGLLPKPEPKLKRSNIMYALGDEALTNPSLAEKMVRDQEEKRLQAHIEHNESKKLTLEEKRAKKLRKVQEDLSVTGVWVAVFRVLSLPRQSFRLKNILQNLKQLTMTGTVVLYKDINLVVAQGGPKQQRKFKHLMLDRIKWSEETIELENSSIKTKNNCCLLVWEGKVPEKLFHHVKLKQFSMESEARSYFRSFNVEHYWDLAFKMSILESIDNKSY